MKHISSILLAILIVAFPLKSQTVEENLKVIINVKDEMKHPVAHTDFKIKNIASEKEYDASTNEEGVHEVELKKGDMHQVTFSEKNQEISYSFRVPNKNRLESYSLVCRLPVNISGKEAAEFDLNGKKPQEKEISVILQNQEGKLLKEHDFKLFGDDSTLIDNLRTDPHGRTEIKLMEAQRYFVTTRVYGEEYMDDFIIDPDADIYTYRLLLPFSRQHHPDDPWNKAMENVSYGKKMPSDSPMKTGGKYKRSFVLRDVHFASGSYEITPKSYPSLDRFAEKMIANPDMIVEIAGHTDRVGTNENNMVLSQNRAEAIVNYLVDKGVERHRMTPVGYGEEQPIATNETAAGRAKNRRSEVRVIDE